MANSARLVIGEVRFSYLHVFEPYAFDDAQDKKYSATLLIPKSNTALVAAINKAIKACYEDAVTSRWGGKKPPMDKVTPLRDGDEPNDDGESRGEAYEGCYFLNAKSKTKPEVAKYAGKNEEGKNKFFPILSTEEFYSGCYGHASVAFGAFDNNGNKGISCYLNNLVKSRDGEPLGVAQSTAEQDFAGIAFDDMEDEL